MTTSYYLGVTVKVTDSLSTFIGRSTGTGTVDKLIRRHDVGPIECTSSFFSFFGHVLLDKLPVRQFLRAQNMGIDCHSRGTFSTFDRV